MNTTGIEAILPHALALNDRDRDSLLQALERSFVQSTHEWERIVIREADRRLKQIDNGTAPLLHGEDVMNRARKRNR